MTRKLMTELDIDEIALVRKSRNKKPVNADAIVQVVKAQDAQDVGVDDALLTRVVKACAAFFHGDEAPTPRQVDEETPDAPTVVPVTPPVTAVAKADDAAGSYEELRSKLSDAIRDAHGGYHYVEHTYPDHAVASHYGDDGEEYHSYPYTVDDDGAVQLGARTAVERKTSFEPVAKAMAVAKALVADGEGAEEAKAAAQSFLDTLGQQHETGDAPGTSGTQAAGDPGSQAPAMEDFEVTKDEILAAIGEGLAAAQTTLATSVTESVTKAVDDKVAELAVASKTEVQKAQDDLAAARAEVQKAQEALQGAETRMGELTAAVENTAISKAQNAATPAPAASTGAGTPGAQAATPDVSKMDYGSAVRTLLHHKNG